MTDREYEILSYIRTQRYAVWYAILNEFGPVPGLLDNDAILRNAFSGGMIEPIDSCEAPPLCTVRLTTKGLDALMKADEMREKQESIRQENLRKVQEEKEEHRRILGTERTERNREKRSDRHFQLFLATFEAFLSLIVGILLEHFTGIVDFIIRLFR